MGTLVCTVVLDKQKGVTVEVDNADDNIKQIITMDGTTLTIKVQGASETSTITQKSDSIVIKCKDFTLETETTTCKSTKDTSISADAKMNLKSTSDMSLETQANLSEKATQDVKVQGMNVKTTAQMNAEINAQMGAKIAAAAGQAQVQGLTLTLQGQTEAQMSAPMISVNADGELSLMSDGMATLQGSMTSVSGEMISLG
jgi:phage baseplate assembly protein gpV